MRTKYEIGMGQCSQCQIEALDKALALNKKYPDLYGANSSVQDKYKQEFENLYDSGSYEQPVFDFVADCGGDSISLCHDHMIEAIIALDEFAKRVQAEKK